MKGLNFVVSLTAIPDKRHYYMVSGGIWRPVTWSQKEKYKCSCFHIGERNSLNTIVKDLAAVLALGMIWNDFKIYEFQHARRCLQVT